MATSCALSVCLPVLTQLIMSARKPCPLRPAAIHNHRHSNGGDGLGRLGAQRAHGTGAPGAMGGLRGR